jgi:hypothetical protein
VLGKCRRKVRDWIEKIRLYEMRVSGGDSLRTL